LILKSACPQVTLDGRVLAVDKLTEKVRAAKLFNMDKILSPPVDYEPCNGVRVIGIKSIEDTMRNDFKWNERGREYLCPSICLAFT
jgi:predicted ATP-dependent serine protease